MWEFSLACCCANKSILEYIKNDFYRKAPNCFITSYEDKHFAYLLFASEDKECADILKGSIITYIIDECKYQYFMQKLAVNDYLLTKAYIKALTMYDVETDIRILQTIMDLDKQLYVDSFIKFHTIPMLRLWQELCEIIRDNYNYLNQDLMIETIRDFINNYRTTDITMKIIVEQNNLALYQTQVDKEPIKLKDKTHAEEIINYIILINPQNIEVYGDTGDVVAINLIKNIYTNKVIVL